LLERIDASLVEKVVIDRNTDSASREQYRRLAATLHHAQAANGIKVVLITSALQGEGKSLTSSNLAMTFSESYQRSVLLIDADLRRPTLHMTFRVDNAGGLSQGLMSREQRRLPVRQVSNRLAILPAGLPSADPMAGLTSERMRQLLDEAREAFDWVIIDTPPVVLLPDANLLASMADAAVLVVKAGSTHYDLVDRALNAIGRDRVLGIVLNRSQTVIDAGYGTYGGYYGPGESSEG
jgi:capsular exopolysaccharide synthesis family protein